MTNTSETKSVEIGGKTSKTTVDTAAATRKGALKLTPARLSMLGMVRDAPTPPVVSMRTSIEANTLHAPTAERLALLGLLAIASQGSDRVASLTDDGAGALNGAPVAAPATPKKAVTKEPEDKKPEAKPAPGVKYVEIVSISDMKVVKRMGPHPERKAEKVAAGAEINLNHDEYCVRVVDGSDVKGEPEPEVKKPEPKASKLAPLPAAIDLRGKDSRINPNHLIVFLTARGINATFTPAPGAKKLIARFSVPAGRTALELTDNLKAAGCSVKGEGDHIEVTNIRYNKTLAG